MTALIVFVFVFGSVATILACTIPTPTCEELNTCEVTPSPSEEVTPSVTVAPTEEPKEEITPTPTFYFPPPSGAGHGDGLTDNKSDNRTDGKVSTPQPEVTLPPCTALTCGWK